METVPALQPGECAVAPRFTARRLVIGVHDLAGFTRAAQVEDDLALATFVDAYYAVAARAIHAAGGRVVKYLGDACLAVFPPERAVDALDAFIALRGAIGGLARAYHLPVAPGSANLHLALVAEGDFGPEGERRYDVLGKGVNHAFLLGARQPPGIHVSEPFYRQLPNERRSRWSKHRPPAVYTLPDG